MSDRRSFLLTRLLPALVLGLSLAAGLALWMGRGSGPAFPGIGGPFQLTAQDGQPFTDARLAGKPSLIFFGYTHCPDVCPTALFQVSEVLKALGPDAKANAVFVTVDPERDTPKVLAEYLSSFDPRIVGLTGDRAQVDAMLRAYRVYSKKNPGANGDYAMDHSALVYLIDKAGRFVGGFNLERPPNEAAAQLRAMS